MDAAMYYRHKNVQWSRFGATANQAPTITSQSTIAFNEGGSQEISLGDLNVTDPDNTYPTGFTLTVQSGTGYSFVGNTITPTNADLNGTLTVPVTVNDGINDSAVYNLSVTVNPVNDALEGTASSSPLNVTSGEGAKTIFGVMSDLRPEPPTATDEIASQTASIELVSNSDDTIVQNPSFTVNGDGTVDLDCTI